MPLLLCLTVACAQTTRRPPRRRSCADCSLEKMCAAVPSARKQALCAAQACRAGRRWLQRDSASCPARALRSEAAATRKRESVTIDAFGDRPDPALAGAPSGHRQLSCPQPPAARAVQCSATRPSSGPCVTRVSSPPCRRGGAADDMAERGRGPGGQRQRCPPASGPGVDGSRRARVVPAPLLLSRIEGAQMTCAARHARSTWPATSSGDALEIAAPDSRVISSWLGNFACADRYPWAAHRRRGRLGPLCRQPRYARPRWQQLHRGQSVRAARRAGERGHLRAVRLAAGAACGARRRAGGALRRGRRYTGQLPLTRREHLLHGLVCALDCIGDTTPR